MPPNNSRHFFDLLYTITLTINPTKTASQGSTMTANPMDQDMLLAHGPSTGTDSMAIIDLAKRLIILFTKRHSFCIQ